MPAPVAQGQMLAGKYRVEKVLGEGGMGVVVAATDVHLERRVAIKFLLPEYMHHAEAATRFMREARAAVKIQSEHIARVIDVSALENGSPYMVMEFLEGGDLSQILEKRGPLPIEDAVGHVLEACDAIAEAHSYGIIHRDLKPANLFLAKQPDGSFKVKVLDFGISKTTLTGQDGQDKSLTRTSSMMGSPLYMSPEQMRSTKDVDARTDIWALGVILYELLAGKAPFDADSIPELSAKILLDEPTPLTRADVPEPLKEAIKRALSKRLPERYPSIAEFASALAPHASKRSRTTVERISRILTQAGLSTGQYDAPMTMPPPTDALAATRVDSAVPATTASTARRDANATVSQWGKTGGALTPERKSNATLFIGIGAAVVVFGGAAAFFVLRSDPARTGPNDVAAAASVQAVISQPPVAQPPAVVPNPAIAPNPAMASAAVDVSPEPAANGTAAASASEKEPAVTAPSTSAGSPAAPNPVSAPVAKTPKAKTPPAAPKAPSTPKAPSPPSSFKDKFGSRK